MAETFPSWRYGPDGQARKCESAADVPAGWTDHPSRVKPDPLDHDGDGRKGGSKARYRRAK